MSQPATVPSLNIPNLVLLKDFLPPYPIGATVRLKSGGPLMTVTALSTSGLIETKWFEGETAKQNIYPIGAVIPGRYRKRSYASV